jgi:hypothetical protein
MRDAELTQDPMHGFIGLLTWDEFDKFTRAIDNARTHIGWWRIAGHLRARDSDELHVRSADPTIPLPGTWLAAEEISNLLQEINQWETLEDVAKFGHEFALLITREVETAMAKWPMSDRPHKVKFLRCRVCQLVTLKYYPPKLTTPSHRDAMPVTVYDPATRHEGVTVTDVIDVTVKCTNCHAVEDSANFSIDAALIHQENEIAKQRLGNGKRRASEGEPGSVDGVPVGGGGEGEDDAPRESPLVVPA